MITPKDRVLNIVSILTISKFFLSSLYSLLNVPDMCIHHPSDISSGYLIYILNIHRAKIELPIFPLISLFSVFPISVTGHSHHWYIQSIGSPVSFKNRHITSAAIILVQPTIFFSWLSLYLPKWFCRSDSCPPMFFLNPEV